MADIFSGKSKAEKPEARKSLMNHIAENWMGTFGVDFHSDDGGNLIRAILEVEEPSENLEKYVREKFPAKWQGWRLVILKVPIGHIDVFHSDQDKY
jgi:hypothetical protein